MRMYVNDDAFYCLVAKQLSVKLVKLISFKKGKF